MMNNQVSHVALVGCVDLGEEEPLPSELSLGSKNYDSFKR
jgi:hypothetical protein